MAPLQVLVKRRFPSRPAKYERHSAAVGSTARARIAFSCTASEIPLRGKLNRQTAEDVMGEQARDLSSDARDHRCEK